MLQDQTNEPQKNQIELPEKARVQLDRIVEAFKTGEIGEAVKAILLRRGNVPSDSWSLSNRLITHYNGTEDARGYRQWQAVGRQVKKGCKAFHILAPRTRTFHDTETGPDGTDEEVKRTVVVGFTAVPVFRMEDTDGEDLEYEDLDPPSPPPLMEVADAFDIKVTYAGSSGDYLGFFSPRGADGQRIVLSTHDETTFWHELGHAAHHRVLIDAGKGGLKGGQVPDQEAVAELCATVLAGLYGRDHTGNAWRYIEHYGNGDAMHLILRVLADVEKSVALILANRG